SLRETVVRAKASGVAEVSDVALMKRLRKSEEWLRSLCVSLLQENGADLAESENGINLRAFDATVVTEPGKTGSQWRIHYSLRIPSLKCDFFKISPTVGEGNGESFKRFPVKENDFILADRGYCSPAGVAYVTKARAHLLLRLNTGALPQGSPQNRPMRVTSKPANRCAARRTQCFLLLRLRIKQVGFSRRTKLKPKIEPSSKKNSRHNRLYATISKGDDR